MAARAALASVEAWQLIVCEFVPPGVRQIVVQLMDVGTCTSTWSLRYR